MCNLFDKSAKRDAMRKAMQAVIERTLVAVERDDAEMLTGSWSNYEYLVRQEFSNRAQDFAGGQSGTE